MQANVGLWEILARQQQIPEAKMNTSWQGVVQPFIGVSASGPLFEATRTSLRSTLGAASGEANLAQDQIIELLAGPAQQSFAGKRTHDEIAQRMRSVLDDQRLVSLDTLFGLYDGLDQMAHGSAVKDQLIPLAGEPAGIRNAAGHFLSGRKGSVGAADLHAAGMRSCRCGPI